MVVLYDLRKLSSYLVKCISLDYLFLLLLGQNVWQKQLQKGIIQLTIGSSHPDRVGGGMEGMWEHDGRRLITLQLSQEAKRNEYAYPVLGLPGIWARNPAYLSYVFLTQLIPSRNPLMCILSGSLPWWPILNLLKLTVKNNHHFFPCVSF